jgi:hypothetical protein
LSATASVAGTFTDTLANGDPASGAVLGVGPGQILILTFIPDHTAFSSAGARVRINIV